MVLVGCLAGAGAQGVPASRAGVAVLATDGSEVFPTQVDDGPKGGGSLVAALRVQGGLAGAPRLFPWSCRIRRQAAGGVAALGRVPTPPRAGWPQGRKCGGPPKVADDAAEGEHGPAQHRSMTRVESISLPAPVRGVGAKAPPLTNRGEVPPTVARQENLLWPGHGRHPAVHRPPSPPQVLRECCACTNRLAFSISTLPFRPVFFGLTARRTPLSPPNPPTAHHPNRLPRAPD